MRYLKSTLAGIAAATATGLALLAYRVYKSPGVDVYVTVFHFPRWIPHWAAEKGMDLWFRVRDNAPLLLILGAFVIAFCWNRASNKAVIPQH